MLEPLLRSPESSTVRTELEAYGFQDAPNPLTPPRVQAPQRELPSTPTLAQILRDRLVIGIETGE